MIKVGVNGAKGRMGTIASGGIEAASVMSLAFAADRGDDLMAAIAGSGADVVVDFTVPAAVFANAMAIIRGGSRPVIGTTGLTPEQLDAIGAALAERELGGIVAPNFSVGAVLMMKLAAEAARLFPDCEIVEIHHEKKLDAPSGTAIATAARIAENRGRPPLVSAATGGEHACRGGSYHGIRVHSVRLPGKMAHQEVVFGGPGETLSIRHDTLSRECFLPGILYAVRRVVAITGLEVGLTL